jgi:uncharacterized protein (DUF1501 family)
MAHLEFPRILDPEIRARKMKNFDLHVDRRGFMRAMGVAAATPMMGSMMQAAYAAGPFTDYKALVCVFLSGGNDSHNMVIPLNAAEYATYAAGRGNLAIPSANVIPVNSGVSGRAFGFHPSLNGLASILNSADRRLAVVSNMGVLLQPTSKTQYQQQINLPPQLFSHSDMQSHWQTGRADWPAENGWGGRMGDLIESANGNSQVSVSITVAGQSLFQKGNNTVAYAVSPWNNTKSTISRRLRSYRDWDNYSATRPNPQKAFEDQLRAARLNKLEDQWGDMAVRALTTGEFVNGALYNLDATGNPIKDATGIVSERFPVNPGPPTSFVNSAGNTVTNRLATQLRSVANMIAARDVLAVKRQIFFVSISGFDNHGDQFKDSNNTTTPILSGAHSDLLKQLDQALVWFYEWTKSQGIAGSVTTYTMSEFGRTLVSNGAGSDHGWGGHQFVLGGAVNPGIYGGPIAGAGQEFPSLARGSGDDLGQGRLIPTTSVDEYGVTFARWMGASGSTEFSRIMPNIGRFARTSGLSFLP